MGRLAKRGAKPHLLELAVDERLGLRAGREVERVREGGERHALHERRASHERVAHEVQPVARHEVRREAEREDSEDLRREVRRVERERGPCARASSVACANVGARKKIHAKHTKWNVANTEMTIPIVLSCAFFASPAPAAPPRRDHARLTASAPPWSAPQITKFHDAPCHSPPSTIVAIRLR